MIRLLVVEDSPTQAEEVRWILSKAGFDVELAADGDAGLAAAQRGGFDLVLSDIVMPGCTGFELCRRIKADATLAQTPVVLFTTLSDPLDVVQSLECGADGFLSKPCQPDTLVHRVHRLLDTRRLRGEQPGGVDIEFNGHRFAITAERGQILDLLLSTFEDVVQKHRDLQATTVRLESTMKELEAFSYSVSHDLRAPLRAIDGFSQALLEDHGSTLDGTGRRHLERICAAAQRMGELIDDLLELSRVGRAEIRQQRVDVSALARTVADELARNDPGRDVELRIADGIVAHGDPRLLRVVLENLIGNAWKFTGKTERASIEIGPTSGEELAGWFVRDNGAGFDPAYTNKLFKAFQRLHRDEEFPGTGIGLATVARIVGRHGGSVRAHAGVGQGAVFHVMLPWPSPGESR